MGLRVRAEQDSCDRSLSTKFPRRRSFEFFNRIGQKLTLAPRYTITALARKAAYKLGIVVTIVRMIATPGDIW